MTAPNPRILRRSAMDGARGTQGESADGVGREKNTEPFFYPP